MSGHTPVSLSAGFAAGPVGIEERHKLAMDLIEKLQGRSMAECAKIFRHVLQEREAELFHKLLLDVLQKPPQVSSSRVRSQLSSEA